MKDKNWLLKTGDPLIQVHLHCILVQGSQKIWLLKTGDALGGHISRFDCNYLVSCFSGSTFGGISIEAKSIA